MCRALAAHRHIRGLGKNVLTHLDRVLFPTLQRLARERPPAAGGEAPRKKV